MWLLRSQSQTVVHVFANSAAAEYTTTCNPQVYRMKDSNNFKRVFDTKIEKKPLPLRCISDERARQPSLADAPPGRLKDLPDKTRI